MSVQEQSTEKSLHILSSGSSLDMNEERYRKRISSETYASRKFSASHWRLQNIVQESMDSSDEEFFDARAAAATSYRFVSPSFAFVSFLLSCRYQDL
ncbi:PITP-less RdgB-like protein isoform X1 [Tachysurus ichikawai]